MRSLFLFALLIIAVEATAQELPEIDTDRPDQTESSSVLPAGTVQIEAGIHREGSSSEHTYSLPAVLVRYAALGWLEIRGIGEYWQYRNTFDTPRQGYLDNGSLLGIGTKVQLARENGALPEIAFLAHVTKTSGTRDSGSNDLAPEFVPQNNLQFDISAGGGLSRSTPDLYLGVGVSYRLPH